MTRSTLTLIAVALTLLTTQQVSAKPRPYMKHHSTYTEASRLPSGAKPFFDGEVTTAGSFYTSYYQSSGSAPWLRVAQKDVGARASQLGVRRNLWCAAAMNHWLRQAGYKTTGSDSASSFARYGTPTTARPGAIAVMTRGGGGHVGIVVRDDGKYVVLLSGNHSNKVAVARYPKSRIYAYRMPTNSQARYASLN